MKGRGLVDSAYVLGVVALLIIAILFVLLRLFGAVFFADTVSGWVLVPAVALALLIILLSASSVGEDLRRWGAVICVLLYTLSVFFHGWENLINRSAEGRSVILEGGEALLILIFAVLCWWRRDSEGGR